MTTEEIEIRLEMARATVAGGAPLPAGEAGALLAELERRAEALTVSSGVIAEDQAKLQAMRYQLVEIAAALVERNVFTASNPAKGRGLLKRVRELLFRMGREGQPVPEVPQEEPESDSLPDRAPPEEATDQPMEV